MIAPSINTGIEETNQLPRFRNDRSDVAPFVSVADEACGSEVVFARRSSMLFADDVVDLTAEKRILCVEKAVFTEIVGPCPNEPPKLSA